MSIQSRAFQIAGSGDVEITDEIEHILIDEDEYDFDEIRRFFNSPGNKRMLYHAINDSFD